MTSRHDNSEFERLLAAHACGELDEHGRNALTRRASEDPRRAGDVEAIDDVLAAFAAERRLRERVLAPAEAREEADEGYRRLSRAAAAREQRLREELQAQDRPSWSAMPLATDVSKATTVPARARGARLLALGFAIAAAVLLGAFLLLQRGPSLLTNAPQDLRSGAVPTIVLTPQIGASASSVEWQAVPGASHYEVLIEDAEGNLVLRRPDRATRNTRWDLTVAEIDALRKRSPQALLLRVVARDGVGLIVATSHDVPLNVR